VRALAPGVDVDDLDAVVRAAVATHGSRLAVASSLGVEDMVVLDAVARAARELGQAPRAFVLDTGRLHESTLLFLSRVRATYAVTIDVLYPSAEGVERLVREQGPYGFRDSIEARKACCAARKLEPLARALEGASAWMTGLRRAQSPTRAAVEVVEVDAARPTLLKLNPLAHWDDARVWAYVARHGVPVHPLHAEGFPSIGCEPCTRAVAPGEDPRAGRWWWESPEHKEGGLHPAALTRSAR
jgi:phosphoadenosine phosphosulfate reductase